MITGALRIDLPGLRLRLLLLLRAVSLLDEHIRLAMKLMMHRGGISTIDDLPQVRPFLLHGDSVAVMLQTRHLYAQA